MYGYKDMSGLVFDRLTVYDQKPKHNDKGELIWLCRCECGTELYVRGYCLRRGQTTSCGCKRGENGKEDWTTHGLSGHPLYPTWTKMIARCHDVRSHGYAKYGAMGVQVCRRWRESFKHFVEDMPPHPGPGYSIDRIDANGDYEPGNCRWATAEMQANNKRRTLRHTFQGKELTLAQIHRIDSSIPYQTLVDRVARGYTVKEAYERSVEDPTGGSQHLLTYKGKRQSLMAWSIETGIRYQTLYHRIKHAGWSVEKALETPVAVCE